jgi:hypothetical protein
MRLLIITNSTLTATIEEMNHFFLLARRWSIVVYDHWRHWSVKQNMSPTNAQRVNFFGKWYNQHSNLKLYERLNLSYREIVFSHCNARQMFLFELSRNYFFPLQRSIRLSFAMMVNKSQGQTIPNVGVYLPASVFSHGQLYVAMSRATSRTSIKILALPFDVDA